MALKSMTAAIAGLDTMTALLLSAPAVLEIRENATAAPINCEASDAGDLLIVTCVMDATAFDPSTNSGGTQAEALANAILDGIVGNSAVGGGIFYWRMKTSGAVTTAIFQGSCAVSGAELNFPGGVGFTAGGTVSITDFFTLHLDI